ncbi:MAG: TOBE domain-containing protein [Campylobacterota bacterium]|nr:TOBE domain-containing protein [Campylobacterota bacterium]
MSNLLATISKIESCDSLHLVKFDFNGQSLSMMSLELNENIKVATKIKLSVKPTNVAIGKDINGKLSHSNQLKAIIKSIQNGKLLSSIVLEFSNEEILESIITKDSVQRLDLKEGDVVTTIIKASDISITELVDA